MNKDTFVMTTALNEALDKACEKQGYQITGRSSVNMQIHNRDGKTTKTYTYKEAIEEFLGTIHKCDHCQTFTYVHTGDLNINATNEDVNGGDTSIWYMETIKNPNIDGSDVCDKCYIELIDEGKHVMLRDEDRDDSVAWIGKPVQKESNISCVLDGNHVYFITSVAFNDEEIQQLYKTFKLLGNDSNFVSFMYTCGVTDVHINVDTVPTIKHSEELYDSIPYEDFFYVTQIGSKDRVCLKSEEFEMVFFDKVDCMEYVTCMSNNESDMDVSNLHIKLMTPKQQETAKELLKQLKAV